MVCTTRERERGSLSPGRVMICSTREREREREVACVEDDGL